MIKPGQDPVQRRRRRPWSCSTARARLPRPLARRTPTGRTSRSSSRTSGRSGSTRAPDDDRRHVRRRDRGGGRALAGIGRRDRRPASISLGQIVFLPGAQRITAVESVLGSTGGSSGAGSGAGSATSASTSSAPHAGVREPDDDAGHRSHVRVASRAPQTKPRPVRRQGTAKPSADDQRQPDQRQASGVQAGRPGRAPESPATRRASPRLTLRRCWRCSRPRRSSSSSPTRRRLVPVRPAAVGSGGGRPRPAGAAVAAVASRAALRAAPRTASGSAGCRRRLPTARAPRRRGGAGSATRSRSSRPPRRSSS